MIGGSKEGGLQREMMANVTVISIKDTFRTGEYHVRTLVIIKTDWSLMRRIVAWVRGDKVGTGKVFILS